MLRGSSVKCKACHELNCETDLALLDEMIRNAPQSLSHSLKDVGTPCLLLDRDRMDRNVSRLRERLDRLGVELRPHLKTAKSVDAARQVMTSPSGPATVSTLKEAEQFARAGVRDMIYAVGVSPDKIRTDPRASCRWHRSGRHA